MRLKEFECGGVNWIRLAQGRDQWRPIVDTVMIIPVPLGRCKFFEELKYCQLL
jgi:hypothetical protein